MAILPPQIPQAELERLFLLRAAERRGPAKVTGAAAPGIAASPTESAAEKKRAVPRPPLAQALSEELRRFAKDESGLTFIDWAITVSIVSLAVGFFIPDLWTLFGEVMTGVSNEVDGVAFELKYLR